MQQNSLSRWKRTGVLKAKTELDDEANVWETIYFQNVSTSAEPAVDTTKVRLPWIIFFKKKHSKNNVGTALISLSSCEGVMFIHSKISQARLTRNPGSVGPDPEKG